jgi:hypothetical protein
LANVGKSVPPAFCNPSLSPRETDRDVLVLTDKKWSIETKDVEKRVVIKDVDRCSVWSVARGPYLLIKLIGISRIKRRTFAVGSWHLGRVVP